MKEIFQELLSSLEQAIAIERGELKPGRVFRVNVKTEVAKARARLGLSQEKFAAPLGISPATLRNWEQGRREPNGAAKVRAALDWERRNAKTAKDAKKS